MPELPDVEGFRRRVNRYARGHRVSGVRVTDPSVVRNTTAQGLGRSLHQRRVDAADRHGKWLKVRTDGPATLLFHFGMTGALEWRSRRTDDHDRVIFEMDGGALVYRTQRKLGGVWLARRDADERQVMGELGPDAADVDRGTFVEWLDGRRRGVKAALMNQQLLAGVGNELSDEVLWRARIHPATQCKLLSEKDRRALHRALQQTIKQANRHGRIPAKSGWLEGVRGDDDPACPRCGSAVRRSRVAGRTSYWCPRCQPS